MATVKHTVIFYRQYGKWSATMPFDDPEKAKRHSKQYLEDDSITIHPQGPDGPPHTTKNTREHIKDITFIEVELPE